MLLELSPSISPVAAPSVAAHTGGLGSTDRLLLTPPVGPVAVLSAVDLHASVTAGVTDQGRIVSSPGATVQERIVPSPSARIVRMINKDNLHASGAAGFTVQERIVPSPARIVSILSVHDLPASGAAGFTVQRRIVSSPIAKTVRMINAEGQHASGAASFTGQESIVSSPSARNGSTLIVPSVGSTAGVGRPCTLNDHHRLSASPGTAWSCSDSATAPPVVSSIVPVVTDRSCAVCASPPPLEPALPPAQLDLGLAPSSTVLFSRQAVQPALASARKLLRGGHELSRQDRLLVAERSPAASLNSGLLGPEPGDRGPPPKQGMKDPNEAPEWSLEREIANLIRVLPTVCKLFLIGGELAIQQSRGPDERRKCATDALRAIGGRNGDSLKGCADALALLAIEAERRGLVTGGVPASHILLRAVVTGEDERARRNASSHNSQGGASVAHGVLSSFKKLVDHCGLPMDPRANGVLAAVPRHMPNPVTKAGTPPMAMFAAFDFLCKHLPSGVFRHWARSYTMFCLYHGTRLQDLMDTIAIGIVDGEPCRSIHARVRKSKFGGPMDIHAPNEGVLGVFNWSEEHLVDVGIHGMLPRFSATPAWEITASNAYMVHGVVEIGEARKALYSLYRACPVFISEELRKSLTMSCHGGHSAFNDAGWFVGRVTVDGEHGFDSTDCAAYGHWGHLARSNEEKQSASGSAQPAGRGTAASAGAVATARSYSIGETHMGDRELQLTARRRMVHFMRRKMREDGRQFWLLPSGREDWRILKVRTPRNLGYSLSVGNVSEEAHPPIPNTFYINVLSGPLACPLLAGRDGRDLRFHQSVCAVFEATLNDRDADVDLMISRTHQVLSVGPPNGVNAVILAGGGVCAISELLTPDATRERAEALEHVLNELRAGRRVRFLCNCRPTLKVCHCDSYVRLVARNWT